MIGQDKIARTRIAIVSDGLPPISNCGIGTSHGNLMAALLAVGYDCQGFTFHEYGADSNGCVQRFGLPERCYSLVNRLIKLAIIVLRRLRVLGKDEGFISEASVALLGAFSGIILARRLKAYSPDYIIAPDRGAVSAFWPRSLKAKTVFVSHSNPLRFLNNPLIGLRSTVDARLAFWLEQKALRGCATAICPSRYMKTFFINSYKFQQMVFLLPNSIDLMAVESIKPSAYFEERGLPAGTPVVYIPAAGNQNKGRQFTFELVRRIASGFSGKIGFYLSGPLPGDLEKCLESIPHNATVVNPGNVAYTQNLSLIKACSICVSPTLIENFGMSLLEAQALGLPVVTFDVGGNTDVVEDGVTGYCKALLDVDALVAGTAELLNDVNLRQRMSIAARARAAELFSGKAISTSFSDILMQLRENRT